MGTIELMNHSEFIQHNNLVEIRAKNLIDRGMVFEANYLYSEYRVIANSPEAVYYLLALDDNELSDNAYRALKRDLQHDGQNCSSTDLLTPGKRTRGLGKKTIALRDCILEAFEEINPPFTVRQMFYQMSRRKAVEKEESGYRKVQKQLLDMRRDGIIPYSYIADNTRWMRKPKTFKNKIEVLRYYQEFYRQNLWLDSPVYVEFWCEKDAIASAIYEVTEVYDVPLYPARGYTSETFAFEAAQNITEINKPTYIYYIGDFDPSGWHMGESLREKLFKYSDTSEKLIFRRLATNKNQIEEFNIKDAERETKDSDTRTKDFFATFGNGQPSVEIEAIPPNELRSIVTAAIEQHINKAELDALKREEEAARFSFECLVKAYEDACEKV